MPNNSADAGVVVPKPKFWLVETAVKGIDLTLSYRVRIACV
jgi:hypothetical protein